MKTFYTKKEILSTLSTLRISDYQEAREYILMVLEGYDPPYNRYDVFEDIFMMGVLCGVEKERSRAAAGSTIVSSVLKDKLSEPAGSIKSRKADI